MTEKQITEIISLQEHVSIRLRELGYTVYPSAEHLSRQLATITVLGKAFAETTIPLFLSLDVRHAASQGQIAHSMKAELDELGDAISDVDLDLHSFIDYLQRRQE